MQLRLNLPKELSVSFGDLAGASHRDEVAVVCPNLNHNAGLRPLFGVVPVLLLDEDVVTNFQRRETAGAASQSVLHVELPLAVGLSSLVSSKSPVLSGNKLAGLERESVTENTTEDDLGRAEASDGTGRVPVDEQGLENLVSVQTAGLRSVASKNPLGVFDSQFRSFVSPGMIG